MTALDNLRSLRVTGRAMSAGEIAAALGALRWRGADLLAALTALIGYGLVTR